MENMHKMWKTSIKQIEDYRKHKKIKNICEMYKKLMLNIEET